MSEYEYLERPLPNHIVKQIRTDVIDEFAKELHRIMNEDGICFERTIDKIAEKLKEQKND